jgi:hypothetical protein
LSVDTKDGGTYSAIRYANQCCAFSGVPEAADQNPEQTTPPYKLGGAGKPEVNNRPAASCCMGFTENLYWDLFATEFDFQS